MSSLTPIRDPCTVKQDSGSMDPGSAAGKTGLKYIKLLTKERSYTELTLVYVVAGKGIIIQ